MCEVVEEVGVTKEGGGVVERGENGRTLRDERQPRRYVMVPGTNEHMSCTQYSPVHKHSTTCVYYKCKNHSVAM